MRGESALLAARIVAIHQAEPASRAINYVEEPARAIHHIALSVEGGDHLLSHNQRMVSLLPQVGGITG